MTHVAKTLQNKQEVLCFRWAFVCVKRMLLAAYCNALVVYSEQPQLLPKGETPGLLTIDFEWRWGRAERLSYPSC